MNKLICFIFTFILSLHLLFSCTKNPAKDDENIGRNIDTTEFYYFYYYRSNGRKVYLTPNLQEYTIKLKDDISEEKKQETLNDNFVNFEITNFSKDIIRISFPSSNIDYKKEFEKIPEVEFVSYSFFSESGAVIYIDNTFHVKFKKGISVEEINSFNTQYNARIIGRYGMDDILYLNEIPWDSQYNVLELSRMYFESGFVVFASPNFWGGNDEPL